MFGAVFDGTVHLSSLGELVDQSWRAIPDHIVGVTLDAYVVMPNHLHGIVLLSADASHSPVSLGRVINSFKGAVTRIAQQPVWQSRYYDHIIRGKTDAHRIREYICNNPARWNSDDLFMGGTTSDAL